MKEFSLYFNPQTEQIIYVLNKRVLSNGVSCYACSTNDHPHCWWVESLFNGFVFIGEVN